MSQAMLEASCRVALAALLHDLGKFAERARIDCAPERLATWKQLDCPHWDGRPRHSHTAHTTAGFLTSERLRSHRRRIEPRRPAQSSKLAGNTMSERSMQNRNVRER